MLRLKSGCEVQLGVVDRCTFGDNTFGEIFDAWVDEEGLMLVFFSNRGLMTHSVSSYSSSSLPSSSMRTSSRSTASPLPE